MSQAALPKNFWEKVLATLEIELDHSVVATWLTNTSLYETDEGQLTIACHDAYATSIIENRYTDLIKEVITEITGEKFKLKFIARPEKSGEKASGPLFDNPPEESRPQGLGNRNKKTGTGEEISQTSPYSQVPNPSNLNQNYTFDNFVVGNSNRVSHAAAMSVVDNPGQVYNPLLIYGGTGVGKTHLLHAIGNDLLKKNPQANVRYLTSENFTNNFIQTIRQNKDMEEFRQTYRQLDALLMDDVQFIGSKEATQEEFYHTFNALHQSSRQIVLASDRDPQEIEELADRLVSRLRGGLMVNMSMPDYETRVAIITTKSAKLNMAMDRQMIEFVADLTPDNVREIEGTLLKIKSAALGQDEPTTLGLIKSVLQDKQPAKSGNITQKITPEMIIKLVNSNFETTTKDLCGRRRKKEIVIPRQMAMFLLRNEIGMNYEDIGDMLGGRDHTTIMHGCDKITREIDETKNTYLKSQLRLIREELYV